MCFYEDDCDWTASVSTDEVLTADKPVKCDECQRVIPAGDSVRHIWMQEHEVCRNDPDSVGCPEGCDHDFGETENYDRCQACDQLTEAIHQHELAEGCKEYESRPPLTGLYDAMSEGDGKAYLAKAESLYPGITGRLPASFLQFREED